MSHIRTKNLGRPARLLVLLLYGERPFIHREVTTRGVEVVIETGKTRKAIACTSDRLFGYIEYLQTAGYLQIVRRERGKTTVRMREITAYNPV